MEQLNTDQMVILPIVKTYADKIDLVSTIDRIVGTKIRHDDPCNGK